MSNIHSPNVVTNGIVACWDAGSRASYPGAGTAITDLAAVDGGVSNGTLTDGPTFDSANLGSIDFDGTDDYIDVGNGGKLQITSVITLATWFRTDDDGNGTMVAKWSGGQRAYKMRINGGQMQTLFSSNGSSNTVTLTDPSTSNDNVWHYAVATNDGSGGANTARLYVDGILVDSDTGIASIHNSTEDAYIGLQSGFGFQGLIAYVAIHNVALSDEDVAQNYNAHRKRFGV